jgi:hypothetical protein
MGIHAQRLRISGAGIYIYTSISITAIDYKVEAMPIWSDDLPLYSVQGFRENLPASAPHPCSILHAPRGPQRAIPRRRVRLVVSEQCAGISE